ncbi:probable ATP-dependent RNA helicase DDX52 [Artemia franciscana]|uniref:Probable ATP-dependent RNA helicase DDX52 n=1 Tax=Artemia franciscana TaxID=6661 RepID=A0AA88HMF8_ARTSF|nr:hypothetical protein QYM36_013994 [Artemia franciscana]
MDAYDLFRKLSFGAKFDKKKYYNDALKFQIVQPKCVESQPRPNENLELIERKEIETNVNEVSNVVKDDEDADSCKEEDEEKLKLLSCHSEALLLSKSRKKKAKKRSKQQLLALEQEQTNHFRKVHRIYIQGSDVSKPFEDFSELSSRYGMNSTLIQNINASGYVAPTPIQMQAIPLMMERREVLACAPTGSGKTAAFLIPLIHCLGEPQKKGFRAVVVSPTRELAQQTYRECQKLSEGIGLRIHMIENVSKAVKKFGPQSSGNFDILVTTPNRLIYLLEQDPSDINLKNVEWLVVDESDKLFEDGPKGFRDQLATIYRACQSTQVRRALFSATFAYDVEQWCKLNLDNVVMVTVGAKNAATDIVGQELVFVGSESGKLMAFRNLLIKGLTPPVLVFVESKERAKELFNELIYDGINVDVIHADRTQVQRENIVKGFRTGKIWILISTELMGRGIDFKGVNLVINYDFPSSAISYIHRIGRTGRAGRPGRAVTFFTEEDRTNLRSIAQVMRDSGCEVPEYMLQMKKQKKMGKRKRKEVQPQRARISTDPYPEKRFKRE